MKLAICPGCEELIDIDNIKTFGPNDIVGCGQKEGEFEPCCECGNKYNSVICKALRKEGKWTLTAAKDYKKA